MTTLHLPMTFVRAGDVLIKRGSSLKLLTVKATNQSKIQLHIPQPHPTHAPDAKFAATCRQRDNREDQRHRHLPLSSLAKILAIDPVNAVPDT